MRSYHSHILGLLVTAMFHLAPGLASAAPIVPDARPAPHALDPCETNDDCTNPGEPICNGNVCSPCTQDSECGAADSGIVCNPNGGICLQGCRGAGGNGCPDGGTCTSVDEKIGKCIPKGEGESSPDSQGDPDSHGDPDSGPDSDPTMTEDSATDSKGDPDQGPGSDTEGGTEGGTEGDCNSAPTDGGTEAASGSSSGTAFDTKPFHLDAEDFDCNCNAGTPGAGGPLVLLTLAGLALRRRRR